MACVRQPLGETPPLSFSHPQVQLRKVGYGSTRERKTMHIAVGAELRRHSGPAKAAHELVAPDLRPPPFMCFQRFAIFRCCRMRHLCSLVVAHARVDVMRSLGAQTDNVGFRINQPFTNDAPMRKVAG